MQWLNIYGPDLRRPEFLGAEPHAVGIWLRVLAYAVEQENGGICKSAASWGDRQWQQAAGVTATDVKNAGELIQTRGEDIVVFGYPCKCEKTVKARRIQAKAAAEERWSQHKGPTENRQMDLNEKSLPRRNASRNARRIAEGEGKGEGEIKDNHAGAGQPALELALNHGASAKAPAPTMEPLRQPLFDALAEACGSKPSGMTDSEARGCAVALGAILKASPGVTPGEIRQRAERYRQHFPDAAITPFAVSRHWSACAAATRDSIPKLDQFPEPPGWFHFLRERCDGDAPLLQHQQPWSKLSVETKKTIIKVVEGFREQEKQSAKIS